MKTITVKFSKYKKSFQAAMCILTVIPNDYVKFLSAILRSLQDVKGILDTDVLTASYRKNILYPDKVVISTKDGMTKEVPYPKPNADNKLVFDIRIISALINMHAELKTLGAYEEGTRLKFIGIENDDIKFGIY